MKKTLLSLGLALLTGITVFAQTPRMSLYEEFTGETCPPCASTNPGLNAILLSPVNATKIIPLKWQVPIPSAPTKTWSLYQTNKLEIDWRYRSTGSGGYGYPSQNNASSGISSGVNSAPSGRIDGQHQWVFGAVSDHPAYINNNVITTAQSYTSAFSVDMTHEWNSAKTVVIVTVNIVATANFNAVGPLVFRCVMVERLIQFSVQPGTNGEKQFEDVVISSYPSIQAGTPMLGNWINGQTQSFVLNCTVPSYVRKVEEISMVGFIQDDGDRKVAQATRSKAAYDAAAVSAELEPVCTATTSPKIIVSNAGVSPITNMTITPYIDGAVSPIVVWAGNLASGSSSTVTLDPVTTPVGAGAHTFTYEITAINGLDFNTSNNSKNVNFVVGTGASGNQIAESFSSTVYPPLAWTTVNPNTGITWSRTTATGGYFQDPKHCSKYDFFGNKAVGDVDELYLPPMDLGGGDGVIMTFDYAYAQSTNISNDRLEVLVSKNCGATWTSVFDKAGTALATAPPLLGVAYVPDPTDFAQWQTAQLQLPGFNQSSVLVKFKVTNDNGNNLYLDNVNLSQPNPTGISGVTNTQESVEIYPNPSHGMFTVALNSGVAQTAHISVLNTLGQEVYKVEKVLTEGSQQVSIDLQDQVSGIYHVVIQCGDSSGSKKITIIH